MYILGRTILFQIIPVNRTTGFDTITDSQKMIQKILEMWTERDKLVSL